MCIQPDRSNPTPDLDVRGTPRHDPPEHVYLELHPSCRAASAARAPRRSSRTSRRDRWRSGRAGTGFAPRKRLCDTLTYDLRNLVLLLAALTLARPAPAQDAATEWRADPLPPKRVAVRPVFFVPAGETGPSSDQRARLARHLAWARARYAELLGPSGAFALDTSAAAVVSGRRPVAFYRSRPEEGLPEIVAELLNHFRVSRFACPWVFVIVVMNPHDDYPHGGGRPLNGGLDTGGGLAVLSSFALDRIPFVQSTLQHELGHAAGLPHVDEYGRDMRTDPSLMSYNPAHHTDGFRPAATPGLFTAEDVRALARNQRLFPGLRFDPARHAAAGPYIAPDIVPFAPMSIPGHTQALMAVTTPSGEAYASLASNVVQGEIRPNAGPGVTFDATRMWHSDSSPSGWVELVLTFPVPVTLSRIAVHTQHSGRYHAARRIRVWTGEVAGESLVTDADLASPDAEVAFAPARGRRWRIALESADRGQVTVRGLRFFSGDEEVFPPSVPPPR